MRTQLKIKGLKTEYRYTPIGIGTAAPRFSWKMESGIRNDKQTAYRILVASSIAKLQNNEFLWDTGMIPSVSCFGVVYEGLPLSPCTRYYWRVMLKNKYETSVISDITYFETGYFSLSDWHSRWITAKPSGNVIHARTDFSLPLDKKIKAARLYCATTAGAFGMTTFCVNTVSAFLNGQKISKEVITPGQLAEAKWRALYKCHDVTGFLQNGQNAFGAVLLSMAFSACLRIRFEDSTELEIDLCKNIKVTGNGPYHLWDEGVDDHGGKHEDYNALREFTGFCMPEYNDTTWHSAKTTNIVQSLEEQTVTTEVIESLAPVGITRTGGGHYIIDFGQVINGHIRLIIKNAIRGKRISISYAECLNEKGRLDYESTVNYNRGENGPQIDTYIPKGEEIEIFEPSFANHSFRYIDLIKYPGIIEPQNIQALLVHSTILDESGFSCSDDDINRLFSISRWSQRDNLCSVPTDCPARERHGWLGDALAVCESECINFDVLTFYENWCKNIRDEQMPNGFVPYISPFPAKERICKNIDVPWSSACVFVPWYVYQVYGDTSILQQMYPTICRWNQFLLTLCDEDGILHNGVFYNDHTAQIKMNPDWLGTLYAYACFLYTAEISAVLGYSEESAANTELCRRLREQLRKNYKTRNGFSNMTQSDLAHALAFGIADTIEESAIADAMSKSIIDADYFFTCGCLGLLHIVPMLARYGYNDIIYKMCKIKEEGSFGGWIANHNATTAFEMLRCRDYMSYNHPFLMGSITTWFYEQLAGIRRTSAGYRTFIIDPWLPDEMDFVEGKIDTLYGIICCRAERKGNRMTYDISIPCGTEATVFFSCRPEQLYEQISFLKKTDFILCSISKTSVVLGNGNYHFSFMEEYTYGK